MAYTEKAALKVYLGVDDTDDDVLLDALIAAAQKIIEMYCGQVFEATADTTRYFDATDIAHGGGIDGRDLILDAPLVAITSITNGDGVALALTDYVTQPRGDTPYYAIRIKANSSVFWTYEDDAESAIAVVGKWAYSLTAPVDIVHATKRLAAYFYRQKDNSGDLDRAVLAGNATILPAKIPDDIKLILAPYRRTVG